MRFVGLLVVVWLIVGAVAAFQRGVFHQRRTKLCQRGDDRGNRDRGATQLLRCQSQSDGLSSAATQSVAPTASFQSI
jgi:hypothetical protein